MAASREITSWAIRLPLPGDKRNAKHYLNIQWAAAKENCPKANNTKRQDFKYPMANLFKI